MFIEHFAECPANSFDMTSGTFRTWLKSKLKRAPIVRIVYCPRIRSPGDNTTFSDFMISRGKLKKFNNTFNIHKSNTISATPFHELFLANSHTLSLSHSPSLSRSLSLSLPLSFSLSLSLSLSPGFHPTYIANYIL